MKFQEHREKPIWSLIDPKQFDGKEDTLTPNFRFLRFATDYFYAL